MRKAPGQRMRIETGVLDEADTKVCRLTMNAVGRRVLNASHRQGTQPINSQTCRESVDPGSWLNYSAGHGLAVDDGVLLFCG